MLCNVEDGGTVVKTYHAVYLKCVHAIAHKLWLNKVGLKDN